jgi:sulfatase maturation enzyme AslB (radical SAM superfamily)
MVEIRKNKLRYSPSICITHYCNLSCIYCYQTHESNSTCNLDTAKSVIDEIFDNVPDNMDGVNLGFIGGEPLLEFNLIKEIVAYTSSKKRNHNYVFFATTNGTVLSK